MRWIKVLGTLTALMLLTAGCIKYEATITIDDDGSGSVNVISALDTDAFGEEASLFPTDELCADFSTDTFDDGSLPPDARIEEYDEGSFCGTEISFDLAASTDHSAAIASALDGDGSARLFKQGENWIFETDLDTSEITNDSDGFISDDEFNELLGDASLIFRVDLPGRAIDGQNNATSVGGDGVFEWDIDLLDPPTRLFAQTEPGSGGGDGGGGLGMILLIAGLLLLAAAAGWWFLTQRNKGNDATMAPMGAAPVAGAPVAAAPQAAAAPPVAAAAPPIAATTPPIATTPSTTAATPPVAEPITPANPSAQETVAMSAADAQAAAEQMSTSQPAEAAAAASSETASNQPTWDASINAWVVNDPVRGRLVHDAESNSWKPA